MAGGEPPANLSAQLPLAGHTTWKVGGPAEWFGEPSSEEELQAMAQWAWGQGLPWRLIGAGSNLLISDTGLAGLTLCSRRLQGSQLNPADGLVEARAGEPIPTLARRAARAGLSGLEWAVGIPGTVGGAVAMNAGAQGGCTAEVLRDVTVVAPEPGSVPFILPASSLEFAYRHSRLQMEPLLVLSARFQLSAGHDPRAIDRRTSANLHSRTGTQPYHLPSCGSVFRNPEPLKAGRLIEELGLKGCSVGGAMVSPMHANFIVNTGEATAEQINGLIELVRERVRQAHGLDLHPEVKRLGSFDAAAALAD